MEKWRVKTPDDYWRYRLCQGAEERVGHVGLEVASHIDINGERQRRLKFADGAEYWYYPTWLEKPEKLEVGYERS